MIVSVLSSGSSGNSTYIGTEKTKILIDIGLSCLAIEKKLLAKNINPTEIDAIIITHTHIDHISGLKVFYKKYKPKIYMSKKMFNEIKHKEMIDNYNEIKDNFQIDELSIDIIKTSHDVDDSNGYIIKKENKSLVYITDTGYINRKSHEKLMNHNMYIFESNHDIELLMNGSRPYHIKQRILSDKGHLSNKQASEYLSKFCGDKTECIILAHLSDDNNNEDLAYETLLNQLNKQNKTTPKILISKQKKATELIKL